MDKILKNEESPIIFNHQYNLIILSLFIGLYIFGLTSIERSISKYITSINGSANARVASSILSLDLNPDEVNNEGFIAFNKGFGSEFKKNFNIANTNDSPPYSNSISETFEIQNLIPGISKEFYFAISNANGTKRSEVSQRYSIQISSLENIPEITYNLEPIDSNGNPITKDDIVGKSTEVEGSYIIDNTLSEGQLPCSDFVTHYYKLSLTIPNTVNYIDPVEALVFEDNVIVEDYANSKVPVKQETPSTSINDSGLNDTVVFAITINSEQIN